MQISGLSGVSAYNPYSKTTQMKNVQLPEFGWGKGMFPTHTPANKSDEDIKNAIIELAKQDARNGRHSREGVTLNNQSAEYHALEGEFVQSVSPDRRSIVPAALAQLGKATKLHGGKPIIDDSLTQLILNGTRVGIKNPGVMYDAKSKMMEIHLLPIFAGGEAIGSYSITYGWNWSQTKEEHSRRNEIHDLYYDTWKAETAAINAGKVGTSATQTYNASYTQSQVTQSTTAQQAISRYEQMQSGG